MSSLDRNSPVPLYYQLYSILLNDIREGNIRPGDRLPTENELMKQYDISRATVRTAILDLVHNGYAERQKSKGTFVVDPRANLSYENKVKGFSAVSRIHGRIELTSKVLEKRVLVAPDFLCEPLQIEPGSSVFYLKRVRSIENVPAVYTEDWVPYSFCEGIEKFDFMFESLHAVLERDYGKIPTRAVRTFECCHAENDEQLTELAVKKNHPLLRFISSVYDQDDKPLEFCKAVINGKYTVHE